MRIGFYGMPTAGKSYILDRIDFMDVVMGSKTLREFDPEFDSKDESGRNETRKSFAKMLSEKQTFIMDGHYAFGDEIAFTQEDGRLYDVFLYLYISPATLKDRMTASEKNQKYLKYDIEKWQSREIEGLREYCHSNNKDFYVIDNPPENTFKDVTPIVRFIREIKEGYSCLSFADKCVSDILKKSKSDSIILLDGDKTLTIEDSSSAVFGYKTNLYDGNFYSGYQAWRQNDEFQNYEFEDLKEMPVEFNERVKSALSSDSYILTSGHEKIWGFIAKTIGIDYFYGVEMSADTKYFVTKKLQEAGKYVIAYGDGMNDYYMLKQADEGYLVAKQDGTLSRSLKGKDMEGLSIV